MWHRFYKLLLMPMVLAAAAGVAWAAPPSVAVILPKTPPHLVTIHEAFLKRFAEISADQPAPRFYLQTPNDDYMSLRNSARKAVALNADLILAFGTSAAMAAKAESFETPVLFADAIEPEAIGLVTNNKRDSQLATGVRGNAPLQTLFKLLRDLTNAVKLAIILDGDLVDKQLTAIFKDAAGRRGFDLVPITIQEKTPAAVMRAVADSKAEGLLFIEAEDRHQAIINLAMEQKMPIVSIVPGMAERGALLVMEVSPEEQGVALADMTLKVLNGDFPEAIQVVTPRKSGVVINLISAQKCGVQVPFEVLSQATRIIR